MVVIKITKEWIFINGEKYEFLDQWIVRTKNIFVKNHFFNSENASGGGSIRFEKNYDRFISFFDLDVAKEDFLSEKQFEEGKEFILLKEDLDKYLEDAEYTFRNPPEDYIYFAEGEEEDYESIKVKINEDFKELIEEYESLSETFFEFKMFCKKDKHDLIYLLYENSRSDKLYKLLRKMAIPYFSYFTILKLRKNKKTIFYLKLCSGNKITPEKLENNLKDLKISSNTIKQICASLNAGQNIILTGVPGSGKTHLATIFAEVGMGVEGYVLTTATSDWTTFDTIGGLMPKDNGELEFHEGKFLQAIKNNKWLIIDEINRADIDKAFGQLFTVLSGQDIELLYYIKNESNILVPIKIKTCDKCDSFYDSNDATYYIGKNWRIISTMNSYDKNALFDLSYAFMRRFMIIEVDVPKKFDFIKKLKNEYGEVLYDKFSKDYKDKLEKLYLINKNPNINRQLGPAIFLDILKYLYYRMDLEESEGLNENGEYKYNNQIFSEALIAYMIPQFEGLHSTQRKFVVDFIKKDVFTDEDSDLVINKLNEMKSYFS